MNQLKPVLTLAVICCLFQGCIPNPDVYEDLSGDYFYEDEGPDTKEILSHASGRREIYSKVTGYDYDKNFIVVEQQPVYDEHKAEIAGNLRMDTKRYPTNSGDEIPQSEKEADSILKHDPYYLTVFAHPTNFWIIDNKHNKVYGPLQKADYENMRSQLHVPKGLSIRPQ